MKTTDVIAEMKDCVIESAKTTGVPASLSMAQLILESGNMESEVSKKCHNLFGIKGSYKGQFIVLNSKEFENGKEVEKSCTFRKYPSYADSVLDHAQMLSRMSRYSNIIGCTDYATACRNIQSDGYATDPNYSSKLIRIIEQYNLDELDKEENNTCVCPYMVKVAISNLRIRDNANGNVLRFCPVGSYTIIAEQTTGGHTWGRLKSGAGWIALDVNGVHKI